MRHLSQKIFHRPKTLNPRNYFRRNIRQWLERLDQQRKVGSWFIPDVISRRRHTEQGILKTAVLCNECRIFVEPAINGKDQSSERFTENSGGFLIVRRGSNAPLWGL